MWFVSLVKSLKQKICLETVTAILFGENSAYFYDSNISFQEKILYVYMRIWYKAYLYFHQPSAIFIFHIIYFSTSRNLRPER